MGFNNWPDPLDGDPEVEYLPHFNVALYEQTLAALALDIVMHRIKISDELGCSDSIRVINFGLQEAITNEHIWGYNLRPMAFVKSQVHILGGEQRLRMELVSQGSRDWELSHERTDHHIDFLAHDRTRFEEPIEVDL